MASGMVAFGALASNACNPPEEENVTITGTEGTTNITITGPGENGDGGGVDETAEAGPPDFPGDPFTFHIEETTQFMNVPGVDGCGNDGLNSVGGALWSAMLGYGWTGQYVLNGEGTPYDFMDPSPGLPSPFGQEGTTSDSRRVTVIASHGNVNRLQWGQPGETPVGAEQDCQIRITESMRLGTLVGDVSGAAIYATSCTAYTLNNSLRDTLGVGAEIGQHFGWHNSPYISDGLLASFFEQTGTSIIDGDDGPYPVHNLEAFLGIGQSKPGLSQNSPVVYTPGQTEPEVIERHFNSRMRLGIGLDEEIPEPQAPDTYNYGWVDHGTSPTCEPLMMSTGSSPATAIVQTPEPAAATPDWATREYRLTRIDRSSADLVTRVRAVLTLFSTAEPDAERLERWAVRTLGNPSKTLQVHPFPDAAPGVVVFYHPWEDDLMVMDVQRLRTMPATNHGPEPIVPDEGIGRAAARRAMLDAVAALRGVGVLPEGHSPASAHLGLWREHESRGPDRRAEWVVEYQYTMNRVVDGLEVIDAGVRIGIHRDGEVSSIRLTDVEIITRPASTSDVVSMSAARESLIAAERTAHPEASLIIEHERLGVLLGPDQHTVVSPPSMVFNYSLRFGSDPEATVVSRQKIAIVSLFSGKYAQVHPVPATAGE